MDYNHDRWNLIASHGDERLTKIVQEYMKQLGIYDESVIETISRPFLSSWVHIIIRICECLLGLTPIQQEEGYESPDEDKFEALEGISEELSRKIFHLLPSQLYKYGISEVKKFNDAKEPGSWLFEVISQSIAPTDSAVAKVLTAVCDYLTAEHFELAICNHRDSHGSYCFPGLFPREREDALAIFEAKAFQAMLQETHHIDLSASTSDEAKNNDEMLRSLLKSRYGSISWFCVSEAVHNDTELLILWDRLGLRLNIPDKFEGKTSNATEVGEYNQKKRSICRDLFIQYGTTGMAVRDDLQVKLVPLTYQNCIDIAMTLPIVNSLGNDGDDDIDDSVNDFLKSIRECNEGGSIDINLNETCFGDGATLFQVLAVLVYKCHTGAIEKVNLIGDDLNTFYALSELIPNQLSIEKLDLECLEMSFFGESMTFQDGNKTLIALTHSGELPKFANFPSIGDKVNESYIVGDTNGLSDEDQLGEMKAIHIAACKSDLESLKVLIEKFNAKINIPMFDGSNALICALVSHASDEVIQYLIDHGSNINKQIFEGPGWQNYMTRLAGFTPLIVTVNNKDKANMHRLLKAGADTEKHTGPHQQHDFPVPTNHLMHVFEYTDNGRCYTALHIATLMNSAEMISDLIGIGLANPNSRVFPVEYEHERLGLDFYSADAPPVVDEKIEQAMETIIATALHLADPEHTETVQALFDGGASLLAQNMNLKAAWRGHEGLLSDWLQSDALNLENSVVAVCKAKNLPKDVALYITEFYVSLHVAEHFERAYQQEISDHRYWSWLAIGLIFRVDAKLVEESSNAGGDESAIATAWSLHKHAICRALDTYRVPKGDDVDSLVEFVRIELKKSKGKEATILFDKLRSELFNLELFEQSNEDVDMNCEETADDHDNDEIKQSAKKPKFV